FLITSYFYYFVIPTNEESNQIAHFLFATIELIS
ncbi:hypothetical protein RCH18_002461, partial [Flavobacterium sp. PL11]|nr:hypothetical protein [Flavobacterium sp. PL11]